MKTYSTAIVHRTASWPILALVSIALLFSKSTVILAQCPAPTFASGLEAPIGIVLTQKGNLLVAESGTSDVNTGRVSIVDTTGNRRTFIDGLPSGPSAEGENQPSGPSGLFLRGRTLYLAIGVGDSILLGPNPGTAKPNPNVSSPLFSSVLAIHFSAQVEAMTSGFTMTMADQKTLASGKQVTLTNASGQAITVEMVVNFPNYTSEPRPDYADNVRNSNPFALVAVGNKLYVTNGGQNLIQQVDLTSGAFSTLASFPAIPNPAFNPNDPSTGGPTLDAVPTGIKFADGKLLVSLLRGYPFVAGTSAIVQVDPSTGSVQPFISNLKTAIGVLPVTPDNESQQSDTAYLVLEHASDPGLSAPGMLLRYDKPDGAATTIANCLTFPTSMALDDRTGTLYLPQLTGTIVTIPVTAQTYNSATGLSPTLLNLSTRGDVQTGDNVLIAGFIVGSGAGGGNARVVVRALGPSLMEQGVSGVLQNPVLELHGSDGTLLSMNDDWKQTQQADIQATGLAPKNDSESAILSSLAPGNYTAIVRGTGNTTGVALVEVYGLQ